MFLFHLVFSANAQFTGGAGRGDFMDEYSYDPILEGTQLIRFLPNIPDRLTLAKSAASTFILDLNEVVFSNTEIKDLNFTISSSGVENVKSTISLNGVLIIEPIGVVGSSTIIITANDGNYQNSIDLIIETVEPFESNYSVNPKSISSTTGNRFVVTGDIDGDSDIDFIHDGASQRLTLVRNDGSNSYTTITIDNELEVIYGKLFDIDLDGDLDIVVLANDFTNTPSDIERLYWFSNDGSGNYTRIKINSTISNGQSDHFVITDIDGDDDLDIIIPNAFDNVDRVYIYKNNGMNSFSETFFTVDDVSFIEIKDFDNDGDSDLLYTHSTQLSWLRRNSSAGYDTRVQLVNNVFVQKFDVLDYDGDGDYDVIGQYTAQGADPFGFFVLINDGSGNVTTQNLLNLGGNQFIPFEVGDVTGDGYIDILVEDGLDHKLYLGAAQNAHRALISIDLAEQYEWNFGIEDLDLDGDLDIYAKNASTNTIEIRYNTRIPIAPSKANLVSVQYENFASILNWGANTESDLLGYTIYRGTSTAQLDSIAFVAIPDTQFSDYSVSARNTYYYSVAARDSSGFIGVNSDTISVAVPNHAPMVNRPIRKKFNMQMNFDTYLVADLDEVLIDPDGDELSYTVTTHGDSAVSASITTDANRLHLENRNRGKGVDSVLVEAFDGYEIIRQWFKVDLNTYSKATFSNERIITTSASQVATLIAADIDEDGDVDVVAGTGGNAKIAWYQNDGFGNVWMYSEIDGQAFGPNSVDVADINADGKLDVISTSIYNRRIAWHENNGANSLWPTTGFTHLNYDPYSGYAADVDGDGDLDIIATFRSVHTVGWIENLSNGSDWKYQEIVKQYYQPIAVYPTDIDGDGDLDAIVAYLNTDTIWWYENDGSGKSWVSHNIANQIDGALSVYAVDIDADGDVDIISASGEDNTIAWYENDSSGINWTKHIINSNAIGANKVYAADMDGDGDFDVLSSSSGDDKIAWYENNDFGKNWIANEISINADGASAVHFADIDGDGDLDVLSASNSDNKIAWYENMQEFTMAPNAPQNLVTSIANNSVSLNWSPNTESDIEFYTINRGRSNTQLDSIATVYTSTNPDTLYIDTNVINDSTYFYTVTATNTSGLKSFHSDTVSITLQPQLSAIFTSVTRSGKDLRIFNESVQPGQTVSVTLEGTYSDYQIPWCESWDCGDNAVLYEGMSLSRHAILADTLYRIHLTGGLSGGSYFTDGYLEVPDEWEILAVTGFAGNDQTYTIENNRITFRSGTSYSGCVYSDCGRIRADIFVGRKTTYTEQKKLLMITTFMPETYMRQSASGSFYQNMKQWKEKGFIPIPATLDHTSINSRLLNQFDALQVTYIYPSTRAFYTAEVDSLTAWVNQGGFLFMNNPFNSAAISAPFMGLARIDGEGGGSSGLSWQFNGAPLVIPNVTGPLDFSGNLAVEVMDRPVLSESFSGTVLGTYQDYPVGIYGQYGDGAYVSTFAAFWNQDQTYPGNAYRANIFQEDNISFLNQIIDYSISIQGIKAEPPASINAFYLNQLGVQLEWAKVNVNDFERYFIFADTLRNPQVLRDTTTYGNSNDTTKVVSINSFGRYWYFSVRSKTILGQLGTSSAVDSVFIPQNPNILSVTPDLAISSLKVRLNGTDFGEEIGSVAINDTLAEVLSWNPNQIQVRVPSIQPAKDIPIRIERTDLGRDTVFTFEVANPITVFPGDTNNDGIVNAIDLLPIGQFFGQQGPAYNLSYQWQPILRVPWSADKDTPKRVFADANGDGFIDQIDVLTLANYDSTHTVLKQIQQVDTLSLMGFWKNSSQGVIELSIQLQESQSVTITGISFDLVSQKPFSGGELVQITRINPSLSTPLNMTRTLTESATFAVAVTATGAVTVLQNELTALNLTVNEELASVENWEIKRLTVLAPGGTLIPTVLHLAKLQETSQEEEIRIVEFKLYANFPNPFNPTTTIRYDLPTTSNVSLEIFDIHGRRVAILEKGLKQAGKHSILFNASELASGVYISRLIAGENIFIQKMVMVK